MLGSWFKMMAEVEAYLQHYALEQGQRSKCAKMVDEYYSHLSYFGCESEAHNETYTIR
jgi:hypothetical protein